MKLTDQEKLELRFILRTAGEIFGWFLIVLSLILGGSLESEGNPNYECFIAVDFAVFLLGVWLLIISKKEK